MRRVLVTGGTTFVSRYTAEYFTRLGDEVYVLNRGTRPQSPGVRHICADRHALGDALKRYKFDAVLDICAYTGADVDALLDGLGDFGAHIMISSSAVYPEWAQQPFTEDTPVGPNSIWGAYGTNKIDAENRLRARFREAYILRPPYIYGPMQNVYREPFAFDCAEMGRAFRLPGEGKLPLQFLHVEDLCRFMDVLLREKPSQRVYNVGNPATVTAADWARLCYEAVDAPFTAVSVGEEHPQRAYFPFHDYAYVLDVTQQQVLMPGTVPLLQGLRASYAWYKQHRDSVNRKPLLDYIDKNGI